MVDPQLQSLVNLSCAQEIERVEKKTQSDHSKKL